MLGVSGVSRYLRYRYADSEQSAVIQRILKERESNKCLAVRDRPGSSQRGLPISWIYFMVGIGIVLGSNPG